MDWQNGEVSRLHSSRKPENGICGPATFKVLGYGFVPTCRKGEKGKYQLVVDKPKWKSLKSKLKELTRKTTPAAFDERMQVINQTLRGWVNYFQLARFLPPPENTFMNRRVTRTVCTVVAPMLKLQPKHMRGLRWVIWAHRSLLDCG